MPRYEQDGHVEPVDSNNIKPGHVLRMVNTDGSMASFSDCLVIKVDKNDIHLARPHMCTNQIGSALMQYETFTVRRESLGLFRQVMMSTGKPDQRYFRIGAGED